MATFAAVLLLAVQAQPAAGMPGATATRKLQELLMRRAHSQFELTGVWCAGRPPPLSWWPGLRDDPGRPVDAVGGCCVRAPRIVRGPSLRSAMVPQRLP